MQETRELNQGYVRVLCKGFLATRVDRSSWEQRTDNASTFTRNNKFLLWCIFVVALSCCLIAQLPFTLVDCPGGFPDLTTPRQSKWLKLSANGDLSVNRFDLGCQRFRVRKTLVQCDSSILAGDCTLGESSCRGAASHLRTRTVDRAG